MLLEKKLLGSFLLFKTYLYFSASKHTFMSPKILVAGKYAKAMYGTSLIISDLYPDVNIRLANNFESSFYTLTTSERNVAIQKTLVAIHT
jgi:hypothetical protein